MGPTEPSLRERKKQRTRLEFQRIALELFDEHGFENVTVDDIAERAEISRSTFFRYFPTKEDVLVGRGDEPLAELGAAFVARPDDEPVMRSLRHAVQALAADYEDQRDDFVVIRRIAHDHPSLLARGLEHEAQWADAFAHLLGQRLGSDPGAALRNRVIAGAVIAALRVAIDEWLEDPDGGRSLESTIGEALDVLGEGLGAPSAGG